MRVGAEGQAEVDGCLDVRSSHVAAPVCLGQAQGHCGTLPCWLPLLRLRAAAHPSFCTCFAGTKPLPAALKSVATHFQRYPSVGALTGELTVQRPYRTFLTAVQFCEWKVSHLLQKPIESVCGFLTVLPGAFCAFRWAAVEVRALGGVGQARLHALQSPGVHLLLCARTGPALPLRLVAGRATAPLLLRPLLPGGAQRL